MEGRSQEEGLGTTSESLPLSPELPSLQLRTFDAQHRLLGAEIAAGITKVVQSESLSVLTLFQLSMTNVSNQGSACRRREPHVIAIRRA